MEGVLIQGICNGSGVSICAQNIDGCRRPLIRDVRVLTPIPVRQTPNLSRIGELSANTGVCSAVRLDDGWELGGKKLVGPIAIPAGTFAWFQDPDGNTVGLLNPAKP